MSFTALSQAFYNPQHSTGLISALPPFSSPFLHFSCPFLRTVIIDYNCCTSGSKLQGNGSSDSSEAIPATTATFFFTLLSKLPLFPFPGICCDQMYLYPVLSNFTSPHTPELLLPSCQCDKFTFINLTKETCQGLPGPISTKVSTPSRIMVSHSCCQRTDPLTCSTRSPSISSAQLSVITSH